MLILSYTINGNTVETILETTSTLISKCVDTVGLLKKLSPIITVNK